MKQHNLYVRESDVVRQFQLSWECIRYCEILFKETIAPQMLTQLFDGTQIRVSNACPPWLSDGILMAGAPKKL